MCTTVFPNDSIFQQTAYSILQLFCQNSPELTTQHFSLLNAYYLSPLMSYYFSNTEGQRDQLFAIITYKRVNREVNQERKAIRQKDVFSSMFLNAVFTIINIIVYQNALLSQSNIALRDSRNLNRV